MSLSTPQSHTYLVQTVTVDVFVVLDDKCPNTTIDCQLMAKTFEEIGMENIRICESCCVIEGSINEHMIDALKQLQGVSYVRTHNRYFVNIEVEDQA